MSAEIIRLARIPDPVEVLSEPIDKAYARLVYSMAGLPEALRFIIRKRWRPTS
jgi:hypothetical protein